VLRLDVLAALGHFNDLDSILQVKENYWRVYSLEIRSDS
jgi:hypothetical protein